MITLDSVRAGNVRPLTTMKLAVALGRADFAAKLSAPILLVRVADGDAGEVAQTLVQTLSSVTIPLVPTLGFRTVVSVGALGGPVGTGLRPWGPKDVEPKIRALLSQHVHVAVPLQKRADSTKSHTERVSVGRAMNNDIVLRHASISKFHAWLEADEGGQFYVSDAGSRNCTFVDGVKLAPKVCTLSPFGAELRFAAISATICRPETLWDALHSAAAMT